MDSFGVVVGSITVSVPGLTIPIVTALFNRNYKPSTKTITASKKKKKKKEKKEFFII